MKKVFRNIYEAENFSEKLNKKCCKSFSPYLVKCLDCQEIVCFFHAKTVGKGSKKQLTCQVCYLGKI